MSLLTTRLPLDSYYCGPDPDAVPPPSPRCVDCDDAIPYEGPAEAEPARCDVCATMHYIETFTLCPRCARPFGVGAACAYCGWEPSS